MNKTSLLRHSAAVFFSLLLLLIAYGVDRNDTVPLLSAYTFAFAIYLWLMAQENPPVRYWVVVGVTVRLLLIASEPGLSDDVYRFIWDGRLWTWGIHPFEHVPSYYVEMGHPAADPALYHRLNSPNYFTIYPSFPQFIFWLSAATFPHSIPGSIIVQRLTILVAEWMNIWLIQKLLSKFNLVQQRVLWYALNPLVILELSGNLHHEAWVLLFLLGAVYFLSQNRFYVSAISYALAIASKLIPLIFLPLLFFRLGWKKGMVYLLATTTASALLFLPLMNTEFVSGIGQSLSYYYRKFEFNASLYYLWREWGYYYYGHNIIGNIGWRLATISGAGIVFFSYWTSRDHFRRPSTASSIVTPALMEGWMFVLFIYLLSVTTLHPWYIIPLLAFSLFTTYRFVIVWTYLIFLTYSGYTSHGFQENLYLTAFEYIVVCGFLMGELYRKRILKNT